MAKSPAYDRYPEHRIEIKPERRAVRVTWRGHVIAESRDARELAEGNYPPVLYVPIGDADAKWMSKTTHSTHCPFKGDASYYTLTDGDAEDENAVWVYEDPFDQVAEIRDHLAFYPDRVTIDVDV